MQNVLHHSDNYIVTPGGHWSHLIINSTDSGMKCLHPGMKCLHTNMHTSILYSREKQYIRWVVHVTVFVKQQVKSTRWRDSDFHIHWILYYPREEDVKWRDSNDAGRSYDNDKVMNVYFGLQCVTCPCQVLVVISQSGLVNCFKIFTYQMTERNNFEILFWIVLKSM